MNAPLSKNRTFKVDIEVMEHEYLLSAASRDEGVWHYRFSHLNIRDLHQLNIKGMVNGLTKEKLEMFYSDVCGPIQVDTLSGNRYFVSFIDNFTRKI